MKGINVILYFNSTKYADSLARGLCYECTGLNVFFAQNEEDIISLVERGILITDKNFNIENKTVMLMEDNSNNDKHILNKTCRLNQIIKNIKDIAFREYGVHLYSKEDKRCAIGIFSRKGGMGVTSFAINIARLISARTESRVLYLNCGVIDDYNEYAKIDNFDNTSSKKHFIFMLEQGIRIKIEDYVKQDEWNVYYFKPESNHNSFFKNVEPKQIIDNILGFEYFSYIIIDFGKREQIEAEILKIIEITDEEIIFDNDGDKSFISYTRQDEKRFINYIDRFIEESDILN